MVGTVSPRRSRSFFGLGLALLLAAGCGGPKTHSVEGKVIIEGGEVTKLGEAHVEAKHDTDPAVRASGLIEPDGSFHLTTLHEGRTVKGAPEGTYTLRLVLADFDYEEPDEEPADEDEAPAYRARSKKEPKTPVPVKYLNFKTSGWKTKVPADGSLTLTVSGARKK